MTEQTQELIPIFDGHNDTILSLTGTDRPFYSRTDEGHIDRVRADEGGLAGGFFAVFVPDVDDDPEKQQRVRDLVGAGLDGIQLTGEHGPTLPYAQQFAMAATARLLRIEAGQEINGGEEDDQLAVDPLTFVTSAAELEENIENGEFSGILHFEGAEMIDTNFDALEVFHAMGLRSLGFVWSRSNTFGHGVPFEFGKSPDTGPGLTDAGKALIDACNQLGVMIDLSHMNEKGFWDIAERTQAPLVATHSNAHAICASTRNLTDKQLDAIRDSDGIVGVNFNCGFIRPDGGRDTNTPLEMLADHVDYLVDRIGIDRVAMGSDFDGALMPDDLSDCSKLPNFVNVLRARGYDDDALHKIGYGNWIRVLEVTWGI